MRQSADSTYRRTVVAAHRAFVDAQVERVPLGDDALAQERRGDGDARLRGQLQQRGLEAEAVDFRVGEDHRVASRS